MGRTSEATMEASLLSRVLWILFSTVGFAIVTTFVYVIFYIWSKHRKYAHIPGPKRGSFFLGNVIELHKAFSSGGSFSQKLLDWTLEHGHIFHIFIVQRELVVAVNPSAVKELLVTGNFPKSRWNYDMIANVYGARFLGKGLVSDTDHEHWSARRALMNPAFSRNLLKPMMSEFNSSADRLMENISTIADGKTTISILDKLHRFALDVIGKVAYGMEIDSMNHETNPFPSAIAKTFEGFREYSRNPIERHIPFLRRKFKEDVRNACTFLRKVAVEKIEERRRALVNDESPPDDILSCMMRAHEATDADNYDLIGDDFITFFVAGQETTANGLGFTFMELGRHPEIYNKLREEIDEVLGDRSYVEYADLARLKYCDHLLKETLRMYPPASVTFREINRDGVEFNGYGLPNGTHTCVSTFVSSRHPDFVSDPMRFDPERFAEDSTRPSAYVTFPFVIGPRNCIGQNFAKMEAKVVLAKFVQRFDFTLDPNQSFDIQETTTLRPKGGTMAKISLRN